MHDAMIPRLLARLANPVIPQACPRTVPAMQPAPSAVPDGPAALDVLRKQIVAVDDTMRDLISQRQALVVEYERIRYALMGVPPAADPSRYPQGAYPNVAQPHVAQPTGPHADGPRQEWSGARVRGLLLGLGAALLAISALAFTAVAWSRLGEGGRAVLLIAMTSVVTGLALALRRRLPASAEALAGLAVVLSLIDVYALRRAGAGAGMSWEVWWAMGTAAAAAFAAALGRFAGARTTRLAVAVLAPVAAELIALKLIAPGSATPEWVGAVAFGALAAALMFARTGLGPRLAPREHGVLQLHAVGCWLAAALLAATAAGQPQTTGAAIGPAFAVAMLAAAPAAARRSGTDAGLRSVAATLLAGVPAGVVLTLAGPALSGEALLTAAAIAGGTTVLASLLAPSALRVPALVAGAAIAAPGVAAAVATALPSVVLPLAWLDQPWTGNLARSARDAAEGPGMPAFVHESWPAVGTLLTVAAVGLALGIRNRAWLGITTAAMGFIAALAPLTAGASILATLVATTVATVVALLVAALADRAELRQRLVLLPGVAIAAVPATGWAAVSPAASVATLAVGAVAAGIATLIVRPVPAARSVFAALAVALIVSLAGVATDAAGVGAAPGGFAAALAAGLLVLAGVHFGRYAPAVGGTVEAAAALCAIAALMVAGRSTPWLAGALTALVPIAALTALRRTGYAGVAGVLTLAAVWAWLSAAHVSVVEAYTAPAAAVALAAGLRSWRDGHGRSWGAVGPALVLAIGPTLVLGLAHEDPTRLVAAAVLSFAAVVAGAVLRLQAPLGIGATALLILAIDQWGEEIVRLPRWITLGLIGIALMWIGATFEHRRRDVRRASEVLGRFG